MENYTFKDTTIKMFDRVKIAQTAETKKLGVGGLVGIVYGFTTPSSGQVEDQEIIGKPEDDTAYCVNFENTEQTLWFADHLVEFIDHNPGLEVEIGGKKMRVLASGEMEEVPHKCIWKKICSFLKK